MDDAAAMRAAIEAAAAVRTTTSPNPWVGAVVVDDDGAIVATGATQPPGRPPRRTRGAAPRRRGSRAGATLVTTLEPCTHTGRTPPCVDAIVDAGIRRIVVGIEDPDPKVAGQGIAALRAAGIEVAVGVEAPAVAAQLAPYLTHRRTGRPYVVLKLAATVDGRHRGARRARASGSPARRPGPTPTACGPRATPCSSAPAPSAPTTRRSPSATWPGAIRSASCSAERPPAPGSIPASSCPGDLGAVLDELGGRDVVQLLVEGGATVAHAFHAAGLVDRYVVYLAPAVMGGDDALGLFRGPAAPSIDACGGAGSRPWHGLATTCASTWSCGATP